MMVKDTTKVQHGRLHYRIFLFCFKQDTSLLLALLLFLNLISFSLLSCQSVCCNIADPTLLWKFQSIALSFEWGLWSISLTANSHGFKISHQTEDREITAHRPAAISKQGIKAAALASWRTQDLGSGAGVTEGCPSHPPARLRDSWSRFCSRMYMCSSPWHPTASQILVPKSFSPFFFPSRNYQAA